MAIKTRVTIHLHFFHQRAFFYKHLLDGDVASNTLSWRWVAGLQTPGKTYVAKADNIAFYTDGENAPAASQLASAPFAIKEEPLPKVVAWLEDAAQVASLKTCERLGLWLHPEDLAVEQCWRWHAQDPQHQRGCV